MVVFCHSCLHAMVLFPKPGYGVVGVEIAWEAFECLASLPTLEYCLSRCLLKHMTSKSLYLLHLVQLRFDLGTRQASDLWLRASLLLQPGCMETTLWGGLEGFLASKDFIAKGVERLRLAP